MTKIEQAAKIREQYLAADEAGDTEKAGRLAEKYERLVRRIGYDPYL